MRIFNCVCALLWLVSLSANGFAEEKLTLDEALEIAREHNPQLRTSHVDVGIAAARLVQAKAYPNPDIDFFAGVQNLDEGPAGSALTGSVFGGEISQELEVWGRRGLREKVAEHDISLVELDEVQTWQGVALAVKAAFYQQLLQRQLLNIAEENLGIGKQFLGATELKYQQNEVPYNDVLRARLEVVRLRSDVLGRETDLEIGKHALNILLGRAPETKFVVAGVLSYRPMQRSLEELVTQAMETRPELDHSRTQIERAAQSRRLAKRRRLPNPSLKFWGEKEAGETKLGGGISFDLPLWYRQKGEIREAEAVQDRSQIAQDELRLNIDREARDAYRELMKTGETLEVKKEGIETSAELIRTSFQNYQEGRTSFFNFLETMQSVNAFKIDYYKTLALWHRQRALLEKAIGRDL